jgi:hypothetical protein
MKKQSTKKQQSAAKELTYRLGPSRDVIKAVRASDTKAAYVLTLRCGHKRVGTKRATVRCGRCKGSK